MGTVVAARRIRQKADALHYLQGSRQSVETRCADGLSDALRSVIQAHEGQSAVHNDKASEQVDHGQIGYDD